MTTELEAAPLAPDGERAEKIAAMLSLLVEHSTRTAAVEAFRDRFGCTKATANEWYRDALRAGAGETREEALDLVVCRLTAIAKKAEAAGDLRSATNAYSSLARLLRDDVTPRTKRRLVDDDGDGGPPPELLNATTEEIVEFISTGKMPSRGGPAPALPTVFDAPRPADSPTARGSSQAVRAAPSRADPPPGVSEYEVGLRRRWIEVVDENVLTADDLGSAWSRTMALSPERRPEVLARDISAAVLDRVEVVARWSWVLRSLGLERVKAEVGPALAMKLRAADSDLARKRLLAQFVPTETLIELEAEGRALAPLNVLSRLNGPRS